ncbi:DoxX family protein [Pseudolabrys sp. FHR47]|uniref:DoxX family protein n=1 Tax=Pseudolabrys sp. FHR47 TaxID=2562284 RepID=UPI0010BF4CF1|nr:DoxX family protein [Pseudolabrys sp. FHR47]
MNNNKLLIPGLAGFYAGMGDIAYALLRVVVGVMFLMHVAFKYKIGAAAVAANIMAKNGLEPALPLAYVTMAFETVGGIALVLGLFTRFFAAANGILIAVALFAVHFANGYGASGGGYEYVLLIGVALLLIAMQGGGRYSADRFIGKEL